MAEVERYELLIVDDDSRFREALRSVFEPHFLLVEARCGEEAIEIVQSHAVDLALLDMHMEVLTGLETLKIVRSTFVRIPCILITSDVTDELCRDAAAAEAYSVLKKPVAKKELMHTVAAAVQTAYDDPEFARSLIA